MKTYLMLMVAAFTLSFSTLAWADNTQEIAQKNQMIQMKEKKIEALKKAQGAKKLQLNVLGYKYGKALGSGETLKALGLLADQNSALADIKNYQVDIEATQAEIQALEAEIEVLKTEQQQ